MLKLKNIVKEYGSGEDAVRALRGVSLEFRKSEFVSVLGPSGCGKTTLLNIIGGLDGYTSGDLVIQNRSTKEYKASDWDTYRNHSVGFVFQSYNLIPHQSVLSNVELALTLSGVSKAERRKRAVDALKSVGLGDQLHKKPNQMSGGQMQRVAIARALVNDPEILLADEPTGALDSTTSVQIMDILKEIAKDRLVIMVTHNPELANEYSTRIIKLLDGEVISDSAPYESTEAKAVPDTKKKRSMSFFTALSLSLNNLMTKKGRTFMISFAGSIGIIGIALILSVSTGVQNYIDRVQEDTLSSYPITIEAESADMGAMMSALMEASPSGDGEEETDEKSDTVKVNSVLYELMNTANSLETEKNNLGKLKEYLENSEDFKQYSSAVQYRYDTVMDVYVKDPEGKIVKTDVMSLMEKVYGDMGVNISAFDMGSNPMASYFTGYNVWEQLLTGKDGELINPILKEQYELVDGDWPKGYDEAILIVNKNNEISDLALYSLGLQTADEISKRMSDAMKSEKVDTESLGEWSYDELIGLEFKVILPTDSYQKQGDGYVDLRTSEAGLSYLYSSENAVTVKISAIVRPSDDAVAGMLSGTIGYTGALTDVLLDRVSESEMLKKQKENPDVDVIDNLKFETEEDKNMPDDVKAEEIKAYLETLDEDGLYEICFGIKTTPTEEYLESSAREYIATVSVDELRAAMLEQYKNEMGIEDTASVEEYINKLSDDEIIGYAMGGITEKIAAEYTAKASESLSAVPKQSLVMMFRQEMQNYTNAEWAAIYDAYMPKNRSERTYDEVLKLLGNVDKAHPSAINIYTSTFENKDEIARIIDEYNASLGEENEEDKISYTDYVGLLMSSVSTVISAISYVLIAFVAISLVVSSIMIGIITYISVLERTKEIGILRAIGASKKDIARVFNAETLSVGFAAGLIGILVTLLLLVPINLILNYFTGIEILRAALPVEGAIVLVAISMVLTFIAGLIPARFAANKDPVIALRTE